MDKNVVEQNRGSAIVSTTLAVPKDLYDAVNRARYDDITMPGWDLVILEALDVWLQQHGVYLKKERQLRCVLEVVEGCQRKDAEWVLSEALTKVQDWL